MIMAKMSKESELIMKKQRGYRCENISQGHPLLSEMVSNEVIDLSNLDIPATLGLKVDWDKDYSEKELKGLADKVLAELANRMHIKANYLHYLWLCATEDYDKALYQDNMSSGEIDCYSFDDSSSIVASDLGNEGTLIGSKKPFNYIE